MLIVGLDVASRTGVCWMEPHRSPSTFRCVTVESEGVNAEDKAADLAVFLHQEFVRLKPDFAAIEMPQRNVAQFERKTRDEATGEEHSTTSINPNQLQLSALAGAAVAACEINGVIWGLIAPATWRSSYFGKGWKPADGDWKKAAVQRAGLQNILLPASAQAQRDAAEAVGIA